MEKKTRLRMVSIFFALILSSAVFAGIVEGAQVKERLDVSVNSSETEIIESTFTDKWRNRLFHIENGENEIIATIWGSNDNENWDYWDSTTIGSDDNDNMILGRNHYWYVKLTGRTTSVIGVSIVDATLNYHDP